MAKNKGGPPRWPKAAMANSQTVENQWMTDPRAELPPEIRGLIFDCDGTLVDTMGVHYRAWLQALNGTGIDLPEEKFYSLAGAPTTKIAEMLVREFKSSAAPATIARQKEEFYIADIPLIRELSAVVAIARRQQGKRSLAVASGGFHHVVDRQLAASGLTDLFPIVICADDVTHGKPAPDCFLEAARRMNLKPCQCVVYEDAELGFQAGRAAGMAVVDVRPWHNWPSVDPDSQA